MNIFCLFDSMYIPALYIFCTYMSYTNLLANIVCFKYNLK